MNESKKGSSAADDKRTGLFSKIPTPNTKWPFIGGGVAVIVTLAVKFLIGGVYSSGQAIKLIEALRDSSLYFGAAVATASATILALMLTLLGLGKNTESDFDEWVYRSINQIAIISTVSLCGAVFLLMLLSMPIGEFENFPTNWFIYMYYALVVLVALLAGLVITSVLMLYSAIRYVISIVTPGQEINN